MYKGEAFQILISIVTLSIAFGLILQNIPFVRAFLGISFLSPVMLFVLAFFTVGMAFVLHELGHKIVASALGCIAVYKAWMWGLLLAVLMAVLTNGQFIFAAPGAVHVYKQGLTKRENGIISMAGPFVNVILAFFFFFMMNAAGFVGVIATVGFQLNLWLAFFNLLPIPPLDGYTVFRWNAALWASLMLPLGLLVFVPGLI